MPAPIRIAFGITDLDVGGAERMLVELVTRLDRTRWEPRVYCLQPPGPLAEKLHAAGVPVESFDVRTSWGAVRAYFRWRRALEEFRPQVLQTFLFHANFLGARAGWAAGVPVRLAGVRVAEKRANRHARLSRFALQFLDGQVCVSEEVAAHERETVGVSADRQWVIPNGVDFAEIDAMAASLWAVDRVECGFLPIPPKLIAVGRLDRQKGFDLLLEALAGCRLPFAVLVIGAGPEAAALDARSRELELSDCVQFLGWQADAVKWIKGADVLVLPSRWEGMPNVVLEALACGKPVVATAVEGVRALVKEGETGWLAEPNSASSLSEALTRCLADRERWPAMGAAGRKLVAERFSLDVTVAAYEDLWRSRLAAHGFVDSSS